MKKLVYLFLLLFVLFLSSCVEETDEKTERKTFTITKLEDGYPALPQSPEFQLYKRAYYHFLYNHNLKATYWVAHILTKKMVEAPNLNRENEVFVPDPLLPKETRAVSNDYTRSGYDRGHLCPNGDMNFDQQAMTETFYLSNILPQRPSFNRGIWSDLENQVRRWAIANDSLYIITGGLFSKKPDFIGKNKIAVPSHFYKVIFDFSKRGGQKMIAFVMENKEYDESAYFKYALSVEDLEKMSGITFLTNADSSIVQLKKTLRLADWQ